VSYEKNQRKEKQVHWKE